MIHLSEHSVVIEDSSGVAWEMEISRHTFRDIESRKTESCRVYTWLHHREDIMCLYAFSGIDERRCFLLLNKVNGIGPKQSMKILGMSRPPELFSAIAREDENFLTSLPGIGAKGAKKIILSLKDSIDAILSDSPLSSAESPAAGEGRERGGEHLVQALVTMGFERKAAARALAQVLSAAETSNEGEILRQAIVELS
ncbi:MAG: Holliday junction branch migration protein RuvA [Salinispira sp.]